MNHSPEQLLQLLYDDLAPFVRNFKGTLTVARDPLHFLELLGEAPVGWRLVLHWAGDENQAQDLPVAVNKVELHLGLTCNLGLTAAPGEALMKKRAGGAPSLLKLLSLARDRVRSFVFPDGTSELAWYLGCDPVSLPDGTPLAGYRLRFALMTSDEPVIPRR